MALNGPTGQPERAPGPSSRNGSFSRSACRAGAGPRSDRRPGHLEYDHEMSVRDLHHRRRRTVRVCPPPSPPSSAASTTRCSSRACSSIRSISFPPQMVFFTTPELLEIGGLPFVSPYEKPTRAEALQLLPQGRRHVRPADRVRGDGAVDRARDAPGGTGRRSRCSRSRRDRRAACGASGTRGTSCSRSATTITRTCSDIPGEDLPHVHHYYGEPHPLLPAARGDRRRRQFGGRSGAGDVSRRRARDAGPPRARS